MREIGGAAGVAAVSTALVSQAGLDGFHAGFVLIAVVAALGAVTASAVFPRHIEVVTDDAASNQTGDREIVVAVSTG